MKNKLIEVPVHIGGDSSLTEEQRPYCYKAWSIHRDWWEGEGECADIEDFRAGFIAGWKGRSESDEQK